MVEEYPVNDRGSQPPEQPPEEEIRYPDGRIEHPSVRREVRDVRFRWVAAVLVAACVIAVIHYYVVWRFFFQTELRLQAEIKSSRYAIPTIPPLQLPPQPRLEQLDRLEGVQGAESSNVYERLLAREKVLHTYGETGEKGFVHIPIDKAMELTAGQLPARKEPAPQAAKGNGLVDGGEPNSGRMLRGERR